MTNSDILGAMGFKTFVAVLLGMFVAWLILSPIPARAKGRFYPPISVVIPAQKQPVRTLDEPEPVKNKANIAKGEKESRSARITEDNAEARARIAAVLAAIKELQAALAALQK